MLSMRMQRGRRTLGIASALVLAALCSGAVAWGAQTWVLEELGTLGGNNSWAYDWKLGAATTSGGETHACWWDLYNRVHDLGTLGGSNSWAYGGGGWAVGAAETSDGETHACYWDATIHDLGTLGGSNSWARDSGYGVVGYSETSGGETHACWWDPGDSGIHDLGTLGGSDSWAYGLGDYWGLAVGAAMTSDGQTHACWWNLQDGTIHDLVPPWGLGPEGAISSTAYAMSGDPWGWDGARVVGWYSSSPDDWPRACVWDITGGTVEYMGDFGHGQAYAVSSSWRRWVAGAATVGDGRTHAFAGHWGGGSWDLNSLFANPPGLELAAATYVGPGLWGPVYSGWGYTPDGGTRGFVLYATPELSTWALLTCTALTGLVLRRRKG
jgi:probable HAF family extracellular repeat protein